MTMIASPRPTHLDHMWELNAAGRFARVFLLQLNLLIAVLYFKAIQGFSFLQRGPVFF
jgi:hypothetical protein